MFSSLPLILLFSVFGGGGEEAGGAGGEEAGGAGGEEAGGEPIPDYNNPYAPIFTDKPVYTWTDRIYMTIVSPSWNTDRHLIDTIGDTTTHPIKIATSDHSLTPYRFVETDANSGIFRAEVTLTGFAYDADGDGIDDTTPRTGGTGPTNGYLEIEPDSGITISFEFADGVLLFHTVDVTWSVGTIDFLDYSLGNNSSSDNSHNNNDNYDDDDSSSSVFLLGDSDSSPDHITVRVIDPDMNLDPQIPNTVMVHLYTDSDAAGVIVRAVETAPASGSFVADVYLSKHHNYLTSSGNRLYVQPGDHLSARYHDYTLPESNTRLSDTMHIESSIKIESSSSPLIELESSPVVLSNSFGDPLTAPPSANTQFQMVGSVTNPDTVTSQPFVYIFQVRNSDGVVEFLSWFQSDIPPEQRLDVSQSWIPETSGLYTIETFVWKSLDDLTPLSEPTSVLITVN